ncbi:MAG TPA: hypothetical protein VK907_04535, partial [Phnomibacter sp.]|nr:hypothetical protein [Phnomibacter sp.]
MKMNKSMLTWVFMLPLFYLAPAQPHLDDDNVSMPSFGGLQEGWNTMKPGGETLCARGTEFVFYVRPASKEKVMVFLYGGGACWDAEGCKEGSGLFVPSIDRQPHPQNLKGIFDLNNPSNPFLG